MRQPFDEGAHLGHVRVAPHVGPSGVFGRAPPVALLPLHGEPRPLSRDERFRFQQALANAGFDPGTPDGVLGRRTRAATRDYQKKFGLIADGYPTADLLSAMEAR